MAKREGGGGGSGLGWLVLGIVFGIAGTLAVEVFFSGSQTDEAEAPAPHAVTMTPPAPQPPAPPVRRARAKPRLAPPGGEAADPGPRDPQAANQVADDAAAAGMTSRATN